MEKYKYQDAIKFLIILFIASFTMGVCYAALGQKKLAISGTANAEAAAGIYISNVEFSADAYDENTNSTNSYSALVLTSNITLSSANANSFIEYDVTVTNSTDFTYAYKGTEISPSFYSNDNIIYEVSGINENDEIASGSNNTFKIRFKYKNRYIS